MSRPSLVREGWSEMFWVEEEEEGGEYVSSLFYNCQHLDSGQQLHLWSMTGGDKTTTN